HRLLAAGDGLELAGVLALGVVGQHDRGRRELDVPAGELRLQRLDALAADRLEDVRGDLLRVDLLGQPVRRARRAGELLAGGLRERRADDLLVQVRERGRVGDAHRPGRRAAAGAGTRAAGARVRRGRGTAAAGRG